MGAGVADGVHCATRVLHDRNGEVVDLDAKGLILAKLILCTNPDRGHRPTPCTGSSDAETAASSASIASLRRSWSGPTSTFWTILLRKPSTTRRRASRSVIPRACR